jgi:hypothetical protein
MHKSSSVMSVSQSWLAEKDHDAYPPASEFNSNRAAMYRTWAFAATAKARYLSPANPNLDPDVAYDCTPFITDKGLAPFNSTTHRQQELHQLEDAVAQLAGGKLFVLKGLPIFSCTTPTWTGCATCGPASRSGCTLLILPPEPDLTTLNQEPFLFYISASATASRSRCVRAGRRPAARSDGAGSTRRQAGRHGRPALSSSPFTCADVAVCAHVAGARDPAGSVTAFPAIVQARERCVPGRRMTPTQPRTSHVTCEVP